MLRPANDYGKQKGSEVMLEYAIYPCIQSVCESYRKNMSGMHIVDIGDKKHVTNVEKSEDLRTLLLQILLILITFHFPFLRSTLINFLHDSWLMLIF